MVSFTVFQCHNALFNHKKKKKLSKKAGAVKSEIWFYHIMLRKCSFCVNFWKNILYCKAFAVYCTWLLLMLCCVVFVLLLALFWFTLLLNSLKIVVFAHSVLFVRHPQSGKCSLLKQSIKAKANFSALTAKCSLVSAATAASLFEWFFICRMRFSANNCCCCNIVALFYCAQQLGASLHAFFTLSLWLRVVKSYNFF